VDNTCIKKLRNLAQKWGGKLVELSRDDFDTRFGGKDPNNLRYPKGLYNAPFSSHDLGIHWAKKQVIYSLPAEWPEIVHEMGHVFACKKNPGRSDESTFLGWEYAVALYIGGPMNEWDNCMGDYGVEGQEYGSLSKAEQQEVLAERLAFAKKKGLIAQDGTPLAIR
jgi:hypothetical protein